MQDTSVPPSGSRNVPMLVLSYLGILALIPLLVETNDPEVQRHAKNGICLMAAEILFVIAVMIISQVPFIGWVIGCGLFPFTGLAFLAIALIAIVKALRGEMLRIPFVTEMSEGWH
jgi:uncharacterized membrane protein